MSELIVSGCIIAPCRKEPEWLVPATLTVPMVPMQLDALLQVCSDHLAMFGYDPTRTNEVGYPERYTYAGTAQLSHNGRNPIHLRKRIEPA